MKHLLPLLFSLLCIAFPALAQPASVLPPGGAVRGWQEVGKTQLYNSNDLYQLVDGEAEAIMAYAFAGCANADYAPAGQRSPSLTVTVYDMSNPLNAFGLFGSDRISGTKVALGAEGVFIAPTGLDFWKGRFVVRCVILRPTPANKAALFAFARAVAGRIHGSTTLPPLLRALPPGRQPQSERYVRQDVAGHDFLRNAITARYPAQGQGAELFIAQYVSAASARAALAAYSDYERRGTGMTPLKGLGDSGFRVVDHFAKNVIVAQKGPYLVGMHHAKQAAAALRLVAQAVHKLK